MMGFPDSPTKWMPRPTTPKNITGLSPIQYSVGKNHKFSENFLDIRIIICQNIRFLSDGYLEQIDEFISAPPMIY